ncbi:MAG: hypothetical protein V7785_10360 [Bermanella sp.]
MRRIKNHIVINIPEPKEEPVKKIFWTNSKKLALIAIVTSWVPFYGYMYLNAFLSGVGFESVYVSMDVWEAVYYFFSSTSEFWGRNFLEGNKYIYYSISIAVIIFIALIVIFYEISPPEPISFKVNGWYISLKASKYYKFLIALFIATLTGTVVYLLPYIVLIGFALIFLFAVVGNLFGLNDGRQTLVEEPCIYAGSDSYCASILIGEDHKVGYVAYSNEKHTFFVASDGLYYLNSKGRVLQHRPFIPSLKKYSLSRNRFDPNNWESNILSRWDMLEDYIENPEYELTRDTVLEHLGQSDSFFHYKEFPAYKLSEEPLCSVAFPYDRATKKVVNVVVYGECKGMAY